MKIAFFDTKPYDRPLFERYGAEHGVEYKFFETKLGEDTADLARGFDGVCIFVNDTANAKVIDRLSDGGVRLIALRCAGFNNVDLAHADLSASGNSRRRACRLTQGANRGHNAIGCLRAVIRGDASARHQKV